MIETSFLPLTHVVSFAWVPTKEGAFIAPGCQVAKRFLLMTLGRVLKSIRLKLKMNHKT